MPRHGPWPGTPTRPAARVELLNAGGGHGGRHRTGRAGVAAGAGGGHGHNPAAAPQGGESFAAPSDGVLKALDTLRGEHAGPTVLVVSPVTPMKILLLPAMLAPPAALRRIQLDVACLCEIDWYAGGIGVV